MRGKVDLSCPGFSLGLSQVCDEEWHHYVLNVELPSVTLYVDGVSHEPFSVTEDYPLHPSRIETQLVVGACWQGNGHWHPLLGIGNSVLLPRGLGGGSRLLSGSYPLTLVAFVFPFLLLGVAVLGIC